MLERPLHCNSTFGAAISPPWCGSGSESRGTLGTSAAPSAKRHVRGGYEVGPNCLPWGDASSAFCCRRSTERPASEFRRWQYVGRGFRRHGCARRSFRMPLCDKVAKDGARKTGRERRPLRPVGVLRFHLSAPGELVRATNEWVEFPHPLQPAQWAAC